MGVGVGVAEPGAVPAPLVEDADEIDDRRNAARKPRELPGAVQGAEGGTAIAAGTLQIGDGGTKGSLAGDVVDNGTLNVSTGATFASGFPIYVLPNGRITGDGTINAADAHITTDSNGDGLPDVVAARVIVPASATTDEIQGAAHIAARLGFETTALTMPNVTVWPSPNGLPIAITKSPTLTRAESPSATVGSSDGGFASSIRATWAPG